MMFWLKLINKQAIFFALLFFFSVLRSHLLAGTVDMVVAKVNSEIITLSSMQDRLKILSQNINTSDNTDHLPPENELMKKALNSIIEQKLKVQQAKKNGYEVSEENILKAFKEIKQNNNISDEQFEAMLKNEGRSLQAYKEELRDQILVSKVTALRMRNIPAATKREIKTYYIEHQKDYWEPPKVKVSHILFILEKDVPNAEIKIKKNKAQKVLSLLNAGKDFATLARKYSEDVSAHSGGDVGIIKHGMMVPEFEEAAFRLKVGEFSDIILTRYGLHIIKCHEVFAGFSRSLDQVKNEIKSQLAIQNRKKAYQKWVDELKKEAFIEISLFKDPSNTFAKNNDVTKFQSAGLTGNEFFNDDELKITAKPKPLRKARNSSSNQSELTEDENSLDYKVIVKKLKYYKRMRDSKKISESEYRKKKKELLRNF